jgi:hypothetical protein
VCRNNAPDITAEDIEISTRSYDSRGRSNNAPMSAIVAPSGKHRSRAGTVGQRSATKLDQSGDIYLTIDDIIGSFLPVL